MSSTRPKSGRLKRTAPVDDQIIDVGCGGGEQQQQQQATTTSSPTPTATLLATTGSSNKRRKTGGVEDLLNICESESASGKTTPSLFGNSRPDRQPPSFKNQNFIHSMKVEAGGKRRVWKNLKQILAAERAMTWKTTDVTYATIDAPPSFYPAKKYSDLSGLPAKYIDPHTKLRYASTEEFAQIRTLPSDITAGLLQLRKANSLVG